MPDRSLAARRHDRRASSRPGWTEIVGASLVAGLLFVALVDPRGDRSSFVVLVFGCVVAWVVGRIVGAARPTVVATAVALAGVAVAVAVGTADARDVAPVSGAALMQSAIACGFVAARARRRGLIAASIVGAVLLALAVSMSGIGAVSAVAAILAAPALVRAAWARPAVVCIAVVFVAMLGVTVALAAREEPPSSARAVQERWVRWHAAWTIMVERPGGVGRGRFDDVPPRYLPLGGARYADHDFLQQGAELGWAGFALTAAVFVWALATLVPIATGQATVALAAASVGALGIHAMFAPVLHVAAVPVLAATLLGAGHAVRPRRAITSR